MTIRVLIIDDSALMRKKIAEILNKDPDIEVVATSRNGEEGLEDIETHKPDVITLDINMPVMDGLTCLALINERYKIPTIMLSSLTQKGELTSFEAIELGAVDIIGKPGGTISRNINLIEDEIRLKVRAAASASLKNAHRRTSRRAVKNPIKATPTRVFTPSLNHKVVLIGASTGGPKNIFDVLPELPSEFNFSIILVQHMPEAFTAGYAERINEACNFEFKEAKSRELLEPGKGYLAPGGFHLTLFKGTSENEYRFRLSRYPSDTRFIPGVDVTLLSFAEVLKSRCIGVIMTGMGNDGVEGMKAIYREGGKTIAESEESCVVYGMPRAAVEANCVDYEIPSHKIAEQIMLLAKDK